MPRRTRTQRLLKRARKAIASSSRSTTKSLKRSWKGIRKSTRKAIKQIAKNRERSAKLKRQGKELVKSAFIAVMPSGHRGVFKRVKKARLPIKELYGPSLADLVDEDSFTAKASSKLSERFDAHVKLLLEKAARG